VTGGDAPLFHGRGCQRRETNDVTAGINMRDSRAVVFIDGDIATIVDGQACFFESEAIDCGAAARGKEGGIGFEALPLFIVSRTPVEEFSVLTGRSLNKKCMPRAARRSRRRSEISSSRNGEAGRARRRG